MNNIPEDLIMKIVSFIPRDRDMKSPTADLLREYITMWKSLRYTVISFEDFMQDPDDFVEMDGPYYIPESERHMYSPMG
jgi:hypothetical protein